MVFFLDLLETLLPAASPALFNCGQCWFFDNEKWLNLYKVEDGNITKIQILNWSIFKIFPIFSFMPIKFPNPIGPWPHSPKVKKQ